MVHGSWFIVAGTGLRVQGFIGFGAWVSGLGFQVPGLVLGMRLVTCSFGFEGWSLGFVTFSSRTSASSSLSPPSTLPPAKFGFEFDQIWI